MVLSQSCMTIMNKLVSFGDGLAWVCNRFNLKLHFPNNKHGLRLKGIIPNKLLVEA